MQQKYVLAITLNPWQLCLAMGGGKVILLLNSIVTGLVPELIQLCVQIC